MEKWILRVIYIVVLILWPWVIMPRDLGFLGIVLAVVGMDMMVGGMFIIFYITDGVETDLEKRSLNDLSPRGYKLLAIALELIIGGFAVWMACGIRAQHMESVFYFILSAIAAGCAIVIALYQKGLIRKKEKPTSERHMTEVPPKRRKFLCEILSSVPKGEGKEIHMRVYLGNPILIVTTKHISLYSETDHFLTRGAAKTGTIFFIMEDELNTALADAKSTDHFLEEYDVTGIEESRFERGGLTAKWKLRSYHNAIYHYH